VHEILSLRFDRKPKLVLICVSGASLPGKTQVLTHAKHAVLGHVSRNVFLARAITLLRPAAI